MLINRSLLVLALALACIQTPARALDFSGPVRVIDGDTMDVGSRRVRLSAIDAPERGQICRTEHGIPWDCGTFVTLTLSARLDGAQVDCTAVDVDRYGRTVATCSLGGADVGRMLVRDGLAFAYPRYGDDYVADERAAAARLAGLWSGSVETPETYRQVRGTAQAPAPPGDCRIKGNISKSGRIYHVPGSTWYDSTGIDSAAGERWFCSEADARAAGWRAPRS